MMIERCKKSDYKHIPSLYGACFEDKDWDKDWYKIEEFQEDAVFVAKEGTELLGFVVSFLRKNVPYISVLGVKKPYRKQGIATKLMDKVFLHFMDYDQVCLHVAKERKEAIRFYQHCGCLVVDEDRKDYKMTCQNLYAFPKRIKKLVREEIFEENTVGMTRSKVLVYQSMVLKIEEESEESNNEHRMLDWLQGKLTVPKLLGFEKKGKFNYLLMEKLPGVMAYEKELLSNPVEAIKLIAQALKTLWDINIDTCPSDQSLDHKLQLAEERIKMGLVDLDDVDYDLWTSMGFNSFSDVLRYLKNHKPNEERVFSHGDFCLPNFFFEDGRLTGYIDLGRSGVSDPWQDIALCIRSLRYNLGENFQEDYIALLMECLGLSFDQEKYNYYLLLDELF